MFIFWQVKENGTIVEGFVLLNIIEWIPVCKGMTEIECIAVKNNLMKNN